jgi:hypothetical protein
VEVRPELERSILGERVSRQAPALRALRHFDSHCGSVGGGNSRRPQHGELRKHFVVHLGDQIILAIGVAAPYLPELYEVCWQTLFLSVSLTSDYRRMDGPSIGRLVTKVLALQFELLRHPVLIGGILKERGMLGALR